MSAFKISASLAGHEQDVKAIVCIDDDVIVSGSRDSTVRTWKKYQTTTNQWGSSTINYKSLSNSFVNSLALIGNPDDSEQLIANGGTDKIINVTTLNTDISLTSDPLYELIGHEGNVCSLSYDKGLLISGSWDSSAKVWENNQVKYDLKGHQSSVWDVKVLSSTEFLTCSADRTIVRWNGDKQVQTYTGHTDVIRKLLLLPEGFASCSNDGTIRIQAFDGKVISILKGHTSFVYDIALLPNGDIVSTGEDRTVRVWRDGHCIQTITFPCISVWCVAVQSNGDIVVGSSDGKVRVFTRDPERYAPEEFQQEFLKSVESSTINEDSLQNLNKEKIPSYEALLKEGKEGATMMVKNPDGIIEAHQWSEGKWNKIGDVVGSSSQSSKTEFNGKEWDYVFDVDIEDGAPPLKLPYNSNENPYTAAERFLAMNELPSSYVDEVVKFIQTNTAGFTINQESASGADDTPVEVYNPYADKRPTTQLATLPQNTPLGFKSFNVDSLIKGLIKFNSEQKDDLVFAPEEIDNIRGYLTNLNLENAVILLAFAQLIINEWSDDCKLIGFDIYRVIIDKFVPQTPKKLISHVKVGVELDSPVILIVVLKLIINALDKKWAYGLITGSDFKELLELINSKFVGYSKSVSNDKQLANLGNSLSTLYYDISVIVLAKKDLNYQKFLITKINDIGDTLVGINSESAYRLLISYGNLMFNSVVIGYNIWLVKSKQLYGNEARFKDTLEDLRRLGV